MKELRFDAADGVWRFAFDLKRRAIVLCGGDECGGSQRRFYRQLIDTADKRFDSHLTEMKRADVARSAPKSIRKQLSPARRRKIAARAATSIAEERSLQELRQAHSLDLSQLGGGDGRNAVTGR